MKPCIRCHRVLPLSDFSQNVQMRDGRINKCKKCVVECGLEWRKKNGRQKELDKVKMERRARGLKKRPNGTGTDPIRQKAWRHTTNIKRRKVCKVILSEFDRFVIEEAVDLVGRRNLITSYSWHLDHIVPINHKLACGLHNGFNLQVVPDWWNCKKGNRNMDTFWT